MSILIFVLFLASVALGALAVFDAGGGLRRESLVDALTNTNLGLAALGAAGLFVLTVFIWAVGLIGLTAVIALIILALGAGAVMILVPAVRPWVWLSTSARADRARRDGRIDDALALYAQLPTSDPVIARLDASLPEWPVRSKVLGVAREVLELNRSIEIARRAGVPQTWLEPLRPGVRDAADHLWRSADRISAAAAQNVEQRTVERALGRETAKLQRLQEATRAARLSLAELTLAGTGGKEELTDVEKRFRTLGEMARALDDVL